jgi:hypothetical protein
MVIKYIQYFEVKSNIDHTNRYFDIKISVALVGKNPYNNSAKIKCFQVIIS